MTFGDASEVKGSPSWSIASLIFLFLVWWWIKRGPDPMVNDRTFPSLRQSWDAFFELVDSGYRRVGLWDHTWARLWLGLQGPHYGVVAGVRVALALGPHNRLRCTFDRTVTHVT